MNATIICKHLPAYHNTLRSFTTTRSLLVGDDMHHALEMERKRAENTTISQPNAMTLEEAKRLAGLNQRKRYVINLGEPDSTQKDLNFFKNAWKEWFDKFFGSR